MSLKTLVSELQHASGLLSKTQIQPIAKALNNAYPNPFCNGDDAAVIANKSGQGYQLICGEGFLHAFTEHDPWHAGFCSVLVNMSDIAAMGGRPTAMTNTYWGKNDEQCEQLFAGMAAASNVFQIPIVGGHTNLQSEKTHLAVSMIGHANQLLSSFAAKPNQSILMAVDLRGEYQKPFLNWNAATKAPAERLRGDFQLLPCLAEDKLATSAKDISQAGTLGTLLMLLESADLGANVHLENIPKPKTTQLSDWLKTFPSFGFLLTCDAQKTEATIKRFAARNIACRQIGTTDTTKQLWVNHHAERTLFWNLNTQPLTGFHPQQKTGQTITPDSNSLTNTLREVHCA